jgi:Xaa-Pro dipeptidase
MFSRKERDRRFRAVRSLMYERKLDCLLIPHHTGEWDNYQADTRYLSCVGGGGAATALVFPLESDPVVIVRDERRIEWWCQQQDWVQDIRAPKSFSWGGAFREVLEERRLTDGNVGVVGLRGVVREAEGIAAYGEVELLKCSCPELSMVSATDLVSNIRKRKSVEEIRMLARAQQCADAMSDAFKAAVREGAGEHEIYADVIAAHIASGGETPTMVLFSADQVLWQTHLAPRFRVLGPSEVAVLEAEAKYFGYIVQSVETVPVRAFHAEEERLLQQSRECLEVVMNAMKPGVLYAELIGLWEQTAEGVDSRPGRTMGHGLGLGQDGPLTARGGRASEAVVEAGDCFILKPWVENLDGTCAVRCGENVVVGEHEAFLLREADKAMSAQDSSGSLATRTTE